MGIHARMFLTKLRESLAGPLILAQPRQRHAKTHHVVRRAHAAFVVAHAGQETCRRLLVLATHVITLTEPVLRTASQRIARVALQK